MLGMLLENRGSLAFCLLLAVCGALAARGEWLSAEAGRAKEDADRLRERVQLLEAEAEAARRDLEKAKGLMARLDAWKAVEEEKRHEMEDSMDADENARDWLARPVPDAVRRLLRDSGKGGKAGPSCRSSGAVRQAGAGRPGDGT